MFNIFKHDKKDILTSISDIGLIRKNNEDSVITITHPDNDKIKLLAVADGVGGYSSGEIASNFVIQALKKWFIKEKTNNFKSTMLIAQHLYKVIIDINNYLYLNEYNKSKCATTLTCAIVTEENTLIANIGDSRAYAIIDQEVVQLTKDDSIVWNYYESGSISKDQIRFHIQNSIITKCIGHEYNTKPSVIKIKNSDYKGILLLTDGVSDCLSDKQIKYIIENSKDSQIAKKLIDEAVYHQQENDIPKGLEFNDILNGKDNATVALYMKHS